MKLTEDMKTYEVPLEGKVFYEVEVIAQSKEEAIQMAYKQAREDNLKNEIYVNFYFDTEVDDFEEVGNNVIAEE